VRAWVGVVVGALWVCFGLGVVRCGLCLLCFGFVWDWFGSPSCWDGFVSGLPASRLGYALGSLWVPLVCLGFGLGSGVLSLGCALACVGLSLGVSWVEPALVWDRLRSCMHRAPEWKVDNGGTFAGAA